MDALSRLIQLARLQGHPDLRCQFAGGYAVDHAPAPRGEAWFHLVLDGACVIEAEGTRPLSLAAGDLAIFPHGAAHRVRDRDGHAQRAPMRLEHDGLLPLRRNTDGAPELDLLCGRFIYTPASTGLLLSALPAALKVSLRDAAGMETLRALVTLMRAEAGQQQPGALAVITALTQALFALALRAHASGDTRHAGLLPLLADARLGAAVRAMLAEPARTWTLAELGRVAAMSRASFARHFGERAGMTPGECLARLRMQIAGDLLLHSRRRTGDIGQEVGYQSEAAFGKAFSHYMGSTPARFRREHTAGAPADAD